MALPGIEPLSGVATSTTTSTSSFQEDLSKKIRKPYTITKSRESWTEPEHDKFLEALQLFDRDWKKIEAFIGSKTVIQIRSHAQKYFLKVLKSGINEHLPPPRPKRKAAHPYPQKASKNVPALSHVSGSVLAETSNIKMGDSSLRSPFNSPATISSWTNNSAYPVDFSQGTTAPSVENKSCGSPESTPRARPVGEITDQGNHGHQLRVLPDFAQVYNFLGSVFDPKASGHLQKLRNMDQIDVETVLLLMRNLSINLSSPEFEDHRILLSSQTTESGTTNDNDASKTNQEEDQPTSVT